MIKEIQSIVPGEEFYKEPEDNYEEISSKEIVPDEEFYKEPEKTDIKKLADELDADWHKLVFTGQKNGIAVLEWLQEKQLLNI